MGLLDSYKSQINAYFSEWIKINDNKSIWTIEDFPYKTGVDEELTYPHCWKCVTVNNCWFKNEGNKKPSYFDYSKYSYTEIPKSTRGLYHPYCHCKEKSINVPRLKDISILKDSRKIKSFFDHKVKWFYSWGYLNKDKDNFINTIKMLVLDQYRKGNYEKEKHTKFGYQINILILIPGINEKNGKFYNVKSAYIVFPEGKLRCVTLVGGENESL